jgi:hypothetical protein
MRGPSASLPGFVTMPSRSWASLPIEEPELEAGARLN